MGYERFRNLALTKNAKRTKQKLELQRFLLDPGADLVVCDEGHIMRNSNSSTSISINKVRTRLRVVLTGTPLQNNLHECKCSGKWTYWVGGGGGGDSGEGNYLHPHISCAT